MVKKTNKTKRRLLISLPLCLVLLAIIGYNISSFWIQIIEKEQEQAFLENELSKLQEDEKNLRVEIQKLQDPDYIARYAREKYLYSKDGEYIIRVP